MKVGKRGEELNSLRIKGKRAILVVLAKKKVKTGNLNGLFYARALWTCCLDPAYSLWTFPRAYSFSPKLTFPLSRCQLYRYVYNFQISYLYR